MFFDKYDVSSSTREGFEATMRSFCGQGESIFLRFRADVFHGRPLIPKLICVCAINHQRIVAFSFSDEIRRESSRSLLIKFNGFLVYLTKIDKQY